MKLLTKKDTDIVKEKQPLFPKRVAKKEQRNTILKKDINLLPRKILEQRRFDESFKKLCFIFIRLLILASLLVIIPFVLRFKLNADKNNLENKISGISGIEDLEKQVAVSKAKLKARQDLITNLNKNDSVISVILTTMEKVMPKTLYLTSVTQGKNNSNQEGNTKEQQDAVKISGVAKDKESIAQFQKSIKDTNLYKSVFITDITETDMKNQKTIRVSVLNENGDLVDKDIPLKVDFKVTVTFEMECILGDWK